MIVTLLTTIALYCQVSGGSGDAGYRSQARALNETYLAQKTCQKALISCVEKKAGAGVLTEGYLLQCIKER